MDTKIPSASLDITTGFGCSSYFDLHVAKDPWADECLRQFIDILINHRQCYFTIPSEGIAEQTSAKNISYALFLAKNKTSNNIKLIEEFTHSFATNENIEDYEIRSHFQPFWEKAQTDRDLILKWAFLHLEDKTISTQNVIAVPKYIADDILNEFLTENNPQKIGMAENYFRYAFDVYIRGLQYSKISKDKAIYFPHPIRGNILSFTPVYLYDDCLWSWGRYFLWLLRTDSTYKDISWLFDQIVAIKELSFNHHSTWYHLIGKPKAEIIEQVVKIGIDLKLPFKIKKEYQKEGDKLVDFLMTVPGIAFIVKGGEVLFRDNQKIKYSFVGQMPKMVYFPGLFE